MLLVQDCDPQLPSTWEWISRLLWFSATENQKAFVLEECRPTPRRLLTKYPVRCEMVAEAHPVRIRLNTLYMRRICSSFVYVSSPESRCDHHSKSIELQISLNQGVNFNVGSSNFFFRLSCDTYCVAWTSFSLGLRSTLALMKRM